MGNKKEILLEDKEKWEKEPKGFLLLVMLKFYKTPPLFLFEMSLNYVLFT